MRAKLKTEKKFREQKGLMEETSTHWNGYEQGSLEGFHSLRWKPRLRNKPTESSDIPQGLQTA